MKRILLTGGGSGGHVFPLMAIAGELKKNPDVQIRYYGPKDIYASYLAGEGIKIACIAAAKLRRYFDWHNFIDVPKLIFSIFQALFKVYWFMPDIAFSKGGPGALPVLIACRFYLIPVIIHESDSVPGLTNRITGKFAKKIELSFENAKKYFSGRNISITGNPVRKELLDYAGLDPGLTKNRLGFEPNRPLILVLGGSLGSVRINDFITGAISDFLKSYQVVHQVGTANFKKIKKMEKTGYRVFAFLEGKNYGEMMAASDLIISRAGAGAIFEIAAFGKPAILIPLPEAANDHQRINAYEYAKISAAEVVEETNLGTIAIRAVKQIISNPKKYQQMAKAALSFAKPDAAQNIAEDILLQI